MKYLQLNDISAYKTAFHLSNYVWEIVIKWEGFAKNTVGVQFVRSADSVSANIAEGFGRYGKKDKIKFYRYSQGSLKETLDWLHKAKARNLLQENEYQHIFAELERLPFELNRLIKYTNQMLRE
ncbi:MAG: four helix bundle protein [Bacteroidales bacterium]